jgi:hypothetical protein
MNTKVRNTLTIALVLAALAFASSAHFRHSMMHGPRHAEGARASRDEVRTMLLRRAQDAHAARDTARAWAAWRDAYATAAASGGWRGLIDVGDAAVGMGSTAKARQSYAASLAQARRQRSVEGVLRTGEAFAGLGDRQVLEQTLRIASHLAGDDPAERARVQDFAAIFAADSASASPDTSARRPY